MIKPLYILFSLSAALALAGCQQESAPAASATPAAATTPTTTSAVPAAHVATIAAVTNPLLSIEPANMTACDPAVTAVVKWDVRKAHSELSTVSVWAGSGPTAKLFITSGASGQAETGQWVRPGSIFELRNPSTDEVLGQIKVGGPVCH